MRANPVQDKWAWAVGPVAVGLGLAAHMVAGGSAPAIPVLLAFAALGALAAQLIGRWVHGPLLLLLFSALAQQLLHFGFVTLGGFFPGNGVLDHLHGGQVLGDVPAGTTSSAGDIHLLLYTHMAAAILTLLIAAALGRLIQAGRILSWAATKSNTT
ncbi:hypothetical protein J2Y66_001220 [Paenarthrobacter nitroguajacolicus]|uniref:hypothetical protein n=1 Tax=Paenarthrobacter nitroguajacolicus TaxID=211146 RepID=UPI002854CC37|nr:hypothetical protein [Paenarthrobacter nitroguajacolicus]MDR6986750.1 hypothetical protein [Paenarthrobacter nitroguajacolicus]